MNNISQAFSDDESPGKIIESLNAKLDAADVHKSQYVKEHIRTYRAIEIMNEIFGQGAWSQRVVSMECCSSTPKEITYIALVEVEVLGRIYRDVGVGIGSGMTSVGDMHELAAKTAASIGLKRTLRVLGNALGLKLYDKDAKPKDKMETKVAEPEPPPKNEGDFTSNLERVAMVDAMPGTMGIVTGGKTVLYTDDEKMQNLIRQYDDTFQFKIKWRDVDGKRHIVTLSVIQKEEPPESPPEGEGGLTY